MKTRRMSLVVFVLVAAAALPAMADAYVPRVSTGVYLGSSPLTWSDPDWEGVTALAADSGGVWVVHGTRAQRLRPVPRPELPDRASG